MKHLTTTFIVAILAISLGIFLPSSIIVDGLRNTPVSEGLLAQLLFGALLLKASLVVFGLFVIVGEKVPLFSENRTSESLFVNIPLSDVLVLAAILFIASILRFYRLGDGLWFDEIVTYVSYVRVPFGDAISTYDNQNQHLLYSVLANLAVGIFGDSVWSLRLPAVLFGLGSIVAIYLLGREVATSREALLSAALLAFSYHHVWFSQNARGYTGLLFWTIFSSWLFLRALRIGSQRIWWLYAVSVAFGAYTLIYMAFVILGHLAIYLARVYREHKREGWSWAWTGLYHGFVLSALLTFLLHSLVLPQFLEAFAHPEVGGPIWTQPLWGILEFIKGLQVNFSGSLVAVFAVLLFAAGFWHYGRTTPAFVALLIIPSVTCVSLKILLGHHLWPRSLFFVMGFGALVVVRGVMICGDLAARLLRWLSRGITRPLAIERRETRIGVAFCTVLILLSAISVYFAYGPKQDFQGAMAFVESRREPADAVVTVGLATLPYKNLYKTDWHDVETLNDLNDVRTHAKRTWLIYTIPIQLQDSFPEIDASIKQDFKEVKQFFGTLNGGTVFVCQGESNSNEIVKIQ